MRPINVSNKEVSLIKELEYDTSNILSEELASGIIAAALRSFKYNVGELTPENIASFKYFMNRMLHRYKEIFIENTLFEMAIAGTVNIKIDENDEYVWFLSEETREKLSSKEESNE
jgi:hypothetical protein